MTWWGWAIIVVLAVGVWVRTTGRLFVDHEPMHLYGED